MPREQARHSSSSPIDSSETIVAPATAPGRGALSVVRLSGKNAHDIGRAALLSWPETARVATLTKVHDVAGTVLDQVVVIRYDAPASFTGEDSVELITHGGAVVSATVVAALVGRGARLARPGEFTRRAVLNGKLDVLQAEATGDLIDAGSRAAQAMALRQLDGGLTRRITSLRSELITLEALIAYDIDFPEEDDGPIAPARILRQTDAVVNALDQLLATARAGELVREGALVVIAGAPNVGKSSLFNALLGESRAIVTDIPGTTRDAIEAVVDTPSLPLRLVDTAGIRDAVDPVERLGVQVSASYVARAAVVLACGDDRESMRQIGSSLAGRTAAPIVAVWTKIDLAPPTDNELEAVRDIIGASSVVGVSAETGTGLDLLLSSVASLATGDAGELHADAPILTRERHRYAVAKALEEVRAFRSAWRGGDVPATVAAVHLREAVTMLEDLIGAVDIEDVLDEVFRRFCVGK
ncbi:MAG TPA: tRNA uridine-5-carboxymethylaminomethyl(34) synthesis GTPase MnmE [Gemmatimonadaceae bacterium]|nr:tRNA uridine-5-carboxymethylaminomethyl(34) synthesis GTPase MnmE [Gemmatimonadaceae bacterium]